MRYYHLHKQLVCSLLTLGVAACGGIDIDPGAVSQAISNNPAPLGSVPAPQPSGGDIQDQSAAIRLGKALFWDVQAGGDGTTACASCHFQGGADNRRVNTIHPGPDGIFASGGVTAAGQTFTPTNITNDDRVGSQGVVGTIFSSVATDPSVAADVCSPDQTAPFFGNRRVTGRNAPSVVGAVYARDIFWDGRANHVFNGSDPFGLTANSGGLLAAVGNGALASQAVGPPNNPTEMSCGGRTFNGSNSLASKMLARRPLQVQRVSASDSVLGSLAAPVTGLSTTYQAMVDTAFVPAVASDSLAQFSRIWGQAIQAYEATLIPDQTPLDRYLAGNKNALTASQQKGLDRFTGKGGCTNCHAGAELSDASVSFFQNKGQTNEDGGDQGFHNLGVRPTSEDLGRAAPGPNGAPFSVSGEAADRGAFKTPGLRNVKLTAPYFHNGSKATLADVVAFYNRGGDFANPEKARRIKPLSFDSGDQSALVDFLTNGLTDCRTEKQQAPFDHPALPVPNGAALPAVGASGTGSCP
jgi:cytochrome c peroxidase